MSVEFLTSNYDKASYLAMLLKSKATGKDASDIEYQQLRHELLSNGSLAPLLPSWLRLIRDLGAFWDFIQPKFETYQERRSFIDREFNRILTHLEMTTPEPIKAEIVRSPTGMFSVKADDSVVAQHVDHTQTVRPIAQVISELQKAESTPTPMNFVKDSDTSTPKQKTKVFIVHGRDNEAKQEVARHIESLGLEAIILHEKASSGMTIIEKIERYAGEADYGIVLYTPCDKGRGAFESNVPPRDRARQNVVFEHGYLMGKLGRSNVCALVKGNIETPNDISGVVYVQHDLGGAWKQDVNRELVACGYKINQTF